MYILKSLMKKVFAWIKNNKLSALLLAIIAGYIIYNSFIVRLAVMSPYRTAEYSGYGRSNQTLDTVSMEKSSIGIPAPEAPPTTDTDERMVVRNSNMSLVVKDVSETQKQILSKTELLGGYIVSTNLRNPQDAATATITIRVPEQNLDQALDFFRALGTKVVSENLYGRDVTDEYIDIEERLEALSKTKARFEVILEQAEEVKDILTVQEELINVQEKIDNLKGRQKYLEQNAALSKVTIYLSTDEYSLPYTPSETWRPKIIFKKAVRSLIKTLRSIGSLAIWLGVYSVLIIPPIAIIWFVRKRKKSKQSTPSA
jgi:hypothetical protein